MPFIRGLSLIFNVLDSINISSKESIIGIIFFKNLSISVFLIFFIFFSVFFFIFSIFASLRSSISFIFFGFEVILILNHLFFYFREQLH